MQFIFIAIFLLLLALYASSSFIFKKLPNNRRRNVDDHNANLKPSQVLTNPQFVSFQKTYFVIYFIILLSDWLNAPYHYKVYYDFKYIREQIAIIYVCGYLSSIIFAPIALTLPDRFGRKSLVSAAALIYAGASIIKCVNSYFALFLSRILSATSSSVLFAACESWYVHEHLESYDFPIEWVGVTLETASRYNGIFSAISGVLGFIIADTFGMHAYGPSIVSALLMVVAVILIQNKWRENRGSGKNIKVKKILTDGIKAIIKTKNVMKLCIVQALVEGVIYVFIFLWTPTLILLFEEQAENLDPLELEQAAEAAGADDAAVSEIQQTPEEIPIGIIFATFMLAMIIGGKLYDLMTKTFKKSNSDMILYATTVATAAMGWLATHHTRKAITTYLAFVLFELACGLYFPSMAALRNRILPQKEMQVIGVWVRIPLNSLATAALLYLHTETDKEAGDKELYLLCTVAMGLAVLICLIGSFKGNDNGNPETTTDGDEEERDIFVPNLKVEVKLSLDNKREDRDAQKIDVTG